MVGVYAGVDVGDDAGAGDMKSVLRIRNAHDCCRGLVRITIPNIRAVIRNGSRVCEPGGRRGHLVQAADEVDHLIEFGVHDTQRISREIEESREVKRAGDQKEVILGVAQSAYYGAGLEQWQSAASGLEPLETKSRADDEAIVGRGRRGPHENEKQTEKPPSRLHDALPRTGRFPSRASKSPATRLTAIAQGTRPAAADLDCRHLLGVRNGQKNIGEIQDVFLGCVPQRGSITFPKSRARKIRAGTWHVSIASVVVASR